MNLSISQTYLLANRAQAKLQREAQKPDLNLRLLLCHAHLLDNIIGHLSDSRSQAVIERPEPAIQPKSKRSQLTCYHEESDDETEITTVFDDSDDDDDTNSYIEYYDKTIYESSPRQIVYNISEITSDDEDCDDGLILSSDEEKIQLSDSEDESSDNSDFSYEEEEHESAEANEEELYEFNYVTTSSNKEHNSTYKSKERLIRTGATNDEVDIADMPRAICA